MNEEEFDELYAKLCNIIDKEMCKLTGFAIPEDVPSTSPQARRCADLILAALAGHGIVLGDPADEYLKRAGVRV